jgi:hypothetical protein
MTEFDVTGLREFELALGKTADDVFATFRPVVQRGAQNIKTDLQLDAEGHPHAPHFPAAISYDTTVTRDGIRAEIGPDKDKRQGALGNILYFGTAKNPAVLDINGPLDGEEPRFTKAIDDALGDLL